MVTAALAIIADTYVLQNLQAVIVDLIPVCGLGGSVSVQYTVPLVSRQTWLPFCPRGEYTLQQSELTVGIALHGGNKFVTLRLWVSIEGFQVDSVEAKSVYIVLNITRCRVIGYHIHPFQFQSESCSIDDPLSR